LDRFLGFIRGFLIQIAHFYDDLGGALGDFKGFSLTIFHRSFGPFMHWIEGYDFIK